MNNKTIKLYDDDAYLTSFDAKVLSCSKTGEGYSVVLDRTAFFPESGGQTSDTGTLGDASVLDVQIDEETGVITHILDKALEEGSVVCGEIDWKRRLDKMQQHTGEHIYSGIVCRRFSCDNVGFHLNGEIMTMDYNRALTADELRETERLVNEAIWKDIEVKAYYPAEEELANIEYRSKKEINSAVRLVSIPGVDVCACCAPHVKRTGEVGLFKLLSFESHKGGVRVYAACGQRAYRTLSEHYDLLTGLAKSLSTSVSEVPGVFDRLRTELSEVKRQAGELSEQLVYGELMNKDSIYISGIQMNSARRALDSWMKEGAGLKAVFIGDDVTGYSFVIGAGKKDTGNVRRDAKETVTLLRDRLGAKGGGSSDMAQGSVKAPKADIEDVLGDTL